ncbi:hypothetical protein Tco_1039111, partial [Tanacetum coccineum]
GELVVGELVVGELVVGELVVGDLVVGDLVGELVVGELIVRDQMVGELLVKTGGSASGLQGLILHRDPQPFVDYVVSKLLVEEIRLKSHDDYKIIGPSIFASTHHIMTSTSTQNRPHSNVTIDEFAYFKQKGQSKSQCPNVPKQN